MRIYIEPVSPEELDDTIKAHLEWAGDWDEALPADVFFGLWGDFQGEKRPLELRARLVEGQLELIAPPASTIKTEANHIYLEDGRELVIQLEG